MRGIANIALDEGYSFPVLISFLFEIEFHIQNGCDLSFIMSRPSHRLHDAMAVSDLSRTERGVSQNALKMHRRKLESNQDGIISVAFIDVTRGAIRFTQKKETEVVLLLRFFEAARRVILLSPYAMLWVFMSCCTVGFAKR